MSVKRMTSRLPSCCACRHCCETAHVSDSSGSFEFISLQKCGFFRRVRRVTKSAHWLHCVCPSVLIYPFGSHWTGTPPLHFMLGCLNNAFRETADLVRIGRRHRVCIQYWLAAGCSVLFHSRHPAHRTTLPHRPR